MSARNARLVTSALHRAKAILTESFNYHLPQSQIALHPVRDRSSAKLLVVPRGEPPLHATFTDLPNLLPPNSIVVLNSTRVIPARLHMQKPTGGHVELLLLDNIDHTTSVAMHCLLHLQRWRVLIGGRNVHVGLTLRFPNHANCDVLAQVVERHQKHAVIHFQCDSLSNSLTLASFLEQQGATPLPQYMRRKPQPEDIRNFQTVYGSEDGSVAAPTAGLHITNQLLSEMKHRGIRTRELVLHVGIGTFVPIATPSVGDHNMHAESLSVPGQLVAEIAAQIRGGDPVVAVGTTSVRTLESLYWFGVRLLRGLGGIQPGKSLFIDQWEPYEAMDKHGIGSLPATVDALSAVVEWCGGSNGHVRGSTRLMIMPGYPFKVIDALITNFHQPKSTLLMLVSAFHGGEPEDLASLYHTALINQYRFLSYGDSSIYASPDFFRGKL